MSESSLSPADFSEPSPSEPSPSSRRRSSRPSVPALRNDVASATVLSAVAGYVDAAGFLALFGMFTAHVTGDLVTIGAALAEPLQLSAIARLAMIPIFMMSVAATALLARRIRHRGSAPLTPLLALMTAALALFCATGVLLEPFADKPDSWAIYLMGGTGVVAMGVQNTLMRDALKSFSPTTIMTGNLTQFTIDLVEMVLPASERGTRRGNLVRAETRRRLGKFGFPLGGFMLGAVLGAWLTRYWGLRSIALPTLVSGVLTAVSSRSPHKH